MSRPLWKGHIAFGLVSIPVTLFSAESRSDLHFKLLDSLITLKSVMNASMKPQAKKCPGTK